MAFNYSTFVNVANTLITKFGGSATLTHKPAGTYNPATSTASSTPTTNTVQAVGIPYDEKLIDGTLILTGDLQVFVAPHGVTSDPQAADKLTIGGASYTVIKCKIYKPASVVVLYELQVRK